MALAVQLILPCCYTFFVALSVCLFVICLIRSCHLLKPFNRFDVILAGALVESSETLCCMGFWTLSPGKGNLGGNCFLLAKNMIYDLLGASISALYQNNLVLI